MGHEAAQLAKRIRFGAMEAARQLRWAAWRTNPICRNQRR